MVAASAQQTVAERGIGVQNIGDGSTIIVYAGLAELSLVRKHARKAEPKTELQLLRVDLRATTLVGREAERSALKAWLTSNRPVSVRCITGRAGVGKTGSPSNCASTRSKPAGPPGLRNTASSRSS
jgi:hypothetical protein